MTPQNTNIRFYDDSALNTYLSYVCVCCIRNMFPGVLRPSPSSLHNSQLLARTSQFTISTVMQYTTQIDAFKRRAAYSVIMLLLRRNE